MAVEAGVIMAAALPSVFSGIIILILTRQQSKADKRAQEREEREELTLESLNAIFSVTKELVDCTLYGKEPNGDLEEAYNYKQKTKHKLEEYYRKRAART